VNRRIPNGTYGAVRGRGLATPSYSIFGLLQGLAFKFGGEYKSRGNQEVFTERYTWLMRKRFRENSSPFFEIIKEAQEKDIALAWHYPADQFCHQLILKDILQKIDKLFVWRGAPDENKGAIVIRVTTTILSETVYPR